MAAPDNESTRGAHAVEAMPYNASVFSGRTPLFFIGPAFDADAEGCKK